MHGRSAASAREVHARRVSSGVERRAGASAGSGVEKSTVEGLTNLEGLTSLEGLGWADATARLAEEGPNVLPTPRRPSPLRRLVGQLIHLFALMLGSRWGSPSSPGSRS